MKFLLFLVMTVLIACNTRHETGISPDEKQLLTQLHDDYKNFWLQNDSGKVVKLFLEDGAIIPPNNKGDIIRGRKSIGNWWFTANGDTTYPIRQFTYKNDTLTADENLAIWEGISEVGWVTQVKDSVISAHQSITNFITVCKKENGEWKIFRQIWNSKPAN